MNLTLFFRLIMMSVYQKSVTVSKRTMLGEEMSYDNTYFYSPAVYAKDGFNVSLQVNKGNYCSSENGYRTLGHTMEDVEFGFPSENDLDFADYAEDSDNITGTVGRIPVSVLETIFEKHGGIDWEKTISVESFNNFMN